MTRHCRQHTLARAILASLIAATAAPALAQSATETQDGKTPAANATRDATTLDKVVVTVERREQDLQKYAGTAQAISGEDDRALGIKKSTDLGFNVGGGVSFDIGLSARLVVEARYFFVEGPPFTSTKGRSTRANASFVPISVGLSF